MRRKILILAVSLIPLFSISCARAKQGEIKAGDVKVEEIKARAEEAGGAFSGGDYQKFADLTYPKLVELMGGREAMIATLERSSKEVKAQGFEFMSMSVDSPKGAVPGETQIFAIVPYTLRMKSGEGVVRQQSYPLAISNKDKVNWTFIDVTNFDESKSKVALPEAAGWLTLPGKQAPVFERNPL
ncbi:MAG TPA: hypothetical protein VN256_26535 [Pyrinomonadaceae bacterium]|nr:hypothetical protein [Pyrinomonadaceae bacterium]